MMCKKISAISPITPLGFFIDFLPGYIYLMGAILKVEKE